MSRHSPCSSTSHCHCGLQSTRCCCHSGPRPVAAVVSVCLQETDMGHTSPTPRPGIFPPTLKGSFVSSQVSPWSVDRRIEPSLGSQSLVYMPTATYTRSVSTGSVAIASMPQSCLNSEHEHTVGGAYVPNGVVGPVHQGSPCIIRVQPVCTADVGASIRDTFG